MQLQFIFISNISPQTMDMAEIWEDIPYTIDLDMVELVELVD